MSDTPKNEYAERLRDCAPSVGNDEDADTMFWGADEIDRLTAALQTARKDERERCAKDIPTSWLDPLLTGLDAVLKGTAGTWGCPDIEALLRAVKKRIALGEEGR